MKGLNLKKVAAVTAGLALVASSAFAVSFSDIADASNHSMKVNGIVVGANAAMSDNEAAANLAAALASKATYMTEAKTEMQMVDECTSAVGSLNKDNAKEKKWTTGSTITVNQNNGSGKLDSLIYETKDNLKLDSLSKSVTFKEEIYVDPAVSYNDDDDVRAYTAEVSERDLLYKVTLSGDALTFSSDFKDSSSDYITMPFLGKWYTLDKVSVSGEPKIELLETSASNTWYEEGQTITGLQGKDGKSYSLKYAEGYYYGDGTGSITLEVYDEETNKMVATEDVDVNSSDSVEVTFYFESGENAGSEVLQDSVYADGINSKSVSNSDIVKAKIRTGANRLVLQNDRCYPDYTESDHDECDWYSVVIIDSSDKLTGYGLALSEATEYDNEDALRAGDYIVLPENYGAVEFVGFESDEMGSVKIAYEDGISFIDNDGQEHSYPFYFDLGTYNLEDVNDIDYTNFVFDGVNYTLALERTDASELTYYVLDSKATSKESATDDDATSDTLTDDESSIETTAITLTNDNDFDVNYNIAKYTDDSGDSYKVWLILSAADLLSNSSTVIDGVNSMTFDGTDIKGYLEGTADATLDYYLIADNTDFLKINETEWYGKDSNYYLNKGDNFAVATFSLSLSDDEDTNVSVYVDTKTNELVNDSDDDVYVDAMVEVETDEDYSLSYTDDDDAESITTNAGATINVEDEYLYIASPKDALNILFNFYDKTGLVTEGEPVCTKVEKQVTVPATEKSYGNLNVISDLEAIAGESYIVVGGYFVNDLFKKVAADKDATAEVFSTPLAVEGDKVKEMINGNLYVAGYTAEDTTEAVNELINDLTMN